MVDERIAYAEDGTLDEIVVAGGAHLERIWPDAWFVEFVHSDGSSTGVWFVPKGLRDPLVENRPAPAKGESKG